MQVCIGKVLWSGLFGRPEVCVASSATGVYIENITQRSEFLAVFLIIAT